MSIHICLDSGYESTRFRANPRHAGFHSDHKKQACVYIFDRLSDKGIGESIHFMLDETGDFFAAMIRKVLDESKDSTHAYMQVSLTFQSVSPIQNSDEPK
jgi:hypothetical protein